MGSTTLFLAAAALAASASDETRFSLAAEWSPIARSAYGFHLDVQSGLGDVLDPGPSVPLRSYDWDAVAPLLPPDRAVVGDVWEPDVAPIVEILRQLDPSASAVLHHHHAPVPSSDPTKLPELGPPLPSAPLGVRATLLAGGPIVDVLLRAHVEFHLEDRAVYYTPGQFEGRLVFDREAQRVVAFHLAVPDRDSNVDINVEEGFGRAGMVDIGYVPRLGVRTKAIPPERDPATLDEARLRLRRAFYAFARIDWLPLDDAVLESERTGKPLHVVVLFGTLDDESC
ncbi:MAG: hypothetical protein AAF726_11730 [Planctomycetota bacterium]